MALPEFGNAHGGPRPGQWCKFKMPAAKQAQLVAAYGAFETADGYLVGIFAPAGRTAAVTATRDGKAVTTGGEYLPPRVHLVDRDGQNVAYVHPDPATRAHELRYFFAALDHPELLALHPLTRKADFPPGRVGNMDVDPAP